MEVLMIKKRFSILFLFLTGASIAACDRYMPISSGSDSDSEVTAPVSDNLKDIADVNALKALCPDQLLSQAHKILAPLSLHRIDQVPITKNQDGSYLLCRELFQDAKRFLQSEYDSSSHYLYTLGSGTIFDQLFTVKFASQQAAQLYVDWLKRTYKYAFIETLKQKFEKSEQQASRRFITLKKNQTEEVHKLIDHCKQSYPSLQNLSQYMITSAALVATSAYGKRLIKDNSSKKYYDYIAIPVSLGVIGHMVLGLYTHHLKSKKIGKTITDLQSILKSIDHESLQIDMQMYDRMIAKFMKDFDARCDRFLDLELQRLQQTRPTGEKTVHEQGQPVGPGALVVRDFAHQTSALQKFTGFFKKMVRQ